MPKKQITLSDIAKACGTSSVTVSKALAGKRGVSDKLREEIFAQAERLGYTPVKQAESGIIGILIPEKFINPNGSFYWALYNNLVQRLKKQGISCIQENITTEEEARLEMPKFLSGTKVNGVISLGQMSEEYVSELRKNSRSLVLLDYYIAEADCDCIITNGFLGGYRLTRYLISEGHRDIGFVGTRLATSSIFDRYMGYMKAMLEYGIPVRDEWIIEDRTTDNALFEHISFPAELPSALVCNCDETAYKVIRDLRLLGKTVPGDVSVVGYDNYLISEICEPPITTINVDAGELAELAVTAILERINRPELPTRIQVLDGKLVIKSSVRSLRDK